MNKISMGSILPTLSWRLGTKLTIDYQTKDRNANLRKGDNKGININIKLFNYISIKTTIFI